MMLLSRGRKEVVAATFLATFLLEVAAFPSPYAGFALDDVRRPVYRGNMRTRDLKTDTEVIVKSDIAVVGAEDGRAASSIPMPATTPTPMAESLKMVTKQLLQAPSATDMVATDVRTPPKVKSQVKPQESITTGFVPLGKGEAQAIPISEDSAPYEIITAPPVRQSTPQTEGLSTWILLSNGEQSTLASSKKKATVHPTVDPKKVHKPTMATPTIEKVKKPEIVKPAQSKPTALPLKKQNVTKEKEDGTKTSTIILQDPKFKNKTPVIVGRVPAVQNKTDAPTKKVASSSTPANGVMTRKRPITLSPTPPTRHVYELVPTTSLLLETGTIETADESSTTETSTSKTTRRPTENKKKKKKNKNRRRRPTKDAEGAESKVEETSVSPSTKIETNARPISTRIYNYLAREVMPSVSVGLVGLVLTAGLAGLFLYPFGGGIARRNYDKGPGHDHQMYYYNSYAPHPEQDHIIGSAQPEESVFGQVLSSMNQNTFTPSASYDTSKYSTHNKYRYDTPDYGHKDNDYNVNGYAGSNDYSTLPDSIKNSDYSIKSDYNSQKTADYAAKTSDYSLKTADYSKSPDYVIKPSDYSAKSDYLVHDTVKNSEYALPEASKYYSMDPMSSHYKLTDNSPQIDNFKHEEQGYPSLTEYASYTNAAAIGTADSYNENTNEEKKNASTSTISEDKSDKSQPHFSALVGSPQFTNTDFVGSVSLTGGYGAHEDIVRHRTGALAVAAEHGPRSLKIENGKSRRKRDVHDDFSNEIDGGDIRFDYDKKPKTTTATPHVTTEDPLTTTTTKFDSTTTQTKFDSTTMSAKYDTTTASKDDTTTTPSTASKDILSSTTASPTPEADTETTTTTTEYPGFNGDKDPFTDSEASPAPGGTSSSGGFLNFIARLAQTKLKIGISLLKTTGEAVTRYLDVVAKRMEQAVRTMENRRRAEQRREKRSPSDMKPTKKYQTLRKKTKKHHKEH